MNATRSAMIGAGSMGLLLVLARPILAGDLNPPAGSIAPTLKTLDQVEPRIPISDATTPGDANSVYKIIKPGSYYLTGEIVGQPSKFGIEVAASNVTIDLRGYSMRATPGNGFSAIYTGFGAGLENVSVLNGHVEGWIDGVDLTGVDGGRVEGVHVAEAQNNAFFLGTSIVVRDCTSIHAAGYGFADQGKCRYVNCIARAAAFDGFGVAGESSLVNCTADTNTSNGFHVTSGQRCSFIDCAANNNGQNGFQATFACIVARCTASNNGNHGILISSSCSVHDNDCVGNGVASASGAGISTNGVDSRVEANNCVDNDIGFDFPSSGNLVVRNSASGNTTNYGPGVTNTSLLATATPWDNIIY